MSSENDERITDIIETLHVLRGDFGVVDDDYRQCRVDVAIEALEECQTMIEMYEQVDAWSPEDYDE